LCTSIGLTTIPKAKAARELTVEGPLVVHWEYLHETLGLSLGLCDVEPFKLTKNIQYDFFARVPWEDGYYVSFRFYWNDGYQTTINVYQKWASSDYGNIMNATGTHHWTSLGNKVVTVRATYIKISDGTTLETLQKSKNIAINLKPIMSDEQGDSPLDGPWDMNIQPVNPNYLAKNIPYIFHAHLYHRDTTHGVVYQYSWGDSPYPENNWVSDDGGGEGLMTHSWTSAGPKTVGVRAGWYPKSNPFDVTWSDWDYVSVYVGDYALTVRAISEYGYPTIQPVYIDGVFVGTTEKTYGVSSGNHQIYVEFAYGYQWFLYYYYGGTYNYNNPMTLSVTSDKTVTAYWENW